ncbi:flagellar biosynthetic protein FliR [Undibacterium jejuense]|uniref:Flagellar biosynthetic protein FliR n=1 Tax=Undibacterium jejuense TaxID=1344949 RepID=A0A923HJ39_9BURK|nr:flagellar biosynthetic protein FliR [Undibacterium jejuense]MBC3861724.1 flagellar biosynthetic protein FliR [Undibacterium jejuense]
MISFASKDLIDLVMAFLWPLTRVLGLIAVAPPFGNRTIPLRIKLGFGIIIALIVTPTPPPFANADALSFSGMMILAQQFVIGLGMGFVMRLVFAAIEMAGTVAGMTMGLGFASFFDPQTRGNTSAVSQFLVLVATVLFFSLNVHHALLLALMDSFKSIPISTTLQSGFDFHRLAIWGEQIFIAGLRLSIPLIAALLLTNVALGILTRAAPQLNIFGIGFSITITVGFLILAAILPYLSIPIENLFQQGIETMQTLGKSPPHQIP